MAEDCCLVTVWLGRAVLALLTWITWLIGKQLMAYNRLAPKAQHKRKLREEAFRIIEEKYGVLSVDAKKIVDLPNDLLIGQLQKRQLTATQVLEAYIAKAFQIHQKHNCIIEFIPMAHTWAQDLDDLQEVKGPLHGVPVSIKDNCDVKGHDSTLGLAKKCCDPKADHSVIVKILLDLGAVPFCKTNVPQTLLSFGCSNPIFGETTNFHNPALTPGGSSGGEATLIAGGGSILGIASDIGGSVRIPAHFSGLYGIKPTNYRLSPTGFTASLPNVIGIAGVPGLMTKSMETMVFAAKALMSNNVQHVYDHMALPIPWNNKPFEERRKLRIGYYTSFPYFPPAGDTEKVVLDAKSALEIDGHTLIPYEMPDGFKIMELACALTFADLGFHFCKNWEGEYIPWSLIPNLICFVFPLWMKRLIGFILDQPIPFIRTVRGSVFAKGGASSSKDLMDRMGERKSMIQQLIRQWKELRLDLVLCPTYPFPAVPTSMTSRMQSAAIYTWTWNLLDFPAGVVPFGKESGTNTHYDTDNDLMLRPVPQAVKTAVGMPISVQLVGLPFEDEMVLYGMKCLSILSPDVNP